MAPYKRKQEEMLSSKAISVSVHMQIQAQEPRQRVCAELASSESIRAVIDLPFYGIPIQQACRPRSISSDGAGEPRGPSDVWTNWLAWKLSPIRLGTGGRIGQAQGQIDARCPPRGRTFSVVLRDSGTVLFDRSSPSVSPTALAESFLGQLGGLIHIRRGSRRPISRRARPASVDVEDAPPRRCRRNR